MENEGHDLFIFHFLFSIFYFPALPVSDTEGVNTRNSNGNGNRKSHRPLTIYSIAITNTITDLSGLLHRGRLSSVQKCMECR